MDLGFQYVLDKIKDITNEPGCYLMKDSHGEIFYIGKAKNLKKRLKSYFVGTDTRLFVQYLEHILFDIDVVVVHNDVEALILERELIKKHQPRYNISLKDDKNYILLKLKKAHKTGRKKDVYPKLEIVRKTKKDQARYFGPYPSASKLRTTVDLINKYFMLRTCSDMVIENRTRPCIQYQIGRCPAPCVYDLPDYGDEIDNTAMFLSGSYQEMEVRLNQKMWILAESEQYEAAAKVRDQLSAIKTSLTKQVVTEVNRKRDQDIIGFHRLGPEVEIVKMAIRGGTFDKSHNFAFSDQPFPSAEILRAFMEQAYEHAESQNIPHDIFLPLSIAAEIKGLTEELQQKAGRALHVLSPQRGKAKKLLEMANKNAEIALLERMKQTQASEQALGALQERLVLSMKPKRIECVDISIIQGTDPFGSLVVFIDGQPDKTKYRLFKIKTVSGMDDFSMIHEVVSRRIKRGISAGDLPDLLLIDGGKGQLNAALKAIEQANLLVNKAGFYVAGIAKARTLKDTTKESAAVEHSDERLFVPEKADPIILKPHTFERYLVERIRDEAHRFAITAHRRARKKRTLQSTILTIPGIGTKRGLLLMKHFGSVQSIKEASAEQIAQVIKVSYDRALEILKALKSST
jgi:excinuclease ABC subunit C